VDSEIWYDAALWQTASKLLPGLGFWPSGLRSEAFALVASFVDTILPLTQHRHAIARTRYINPVVDHVRRRINETVTASDPQVGPRRFVLVGHSLGGGLAKIAGAATGRLAIALSGPGIVEARAKLGLDPSSLDRYAVNISPRHDVVPAVGTTEGLILNVDCPYARPDLCHIPGVTVCELIDRCGAWHAQPHGPFAGAHIACDFDPNSS
jgi:hypothetical protein